MDKINKIYELKNELDLRRPLNQSEIKRIKENYMIKNTYDFFYNCILESLEEYLKLTKVKN